MTKPFERTGMDNLIEGIQQECNRCRELVTEYTQLGPAGAFRKTEIENVIEFAEECVTSGDVMAMVEALRRLRGVTE
jgi:hypothetical protein